MKTLLCRLISFSLFAAVSLHAAAIAPSYKPLAIDLVIEYFGQTENDGADAWKKFAVRQNLGEKDLRQTCETALETARSIIKGGTPPDSPHFARILADSLDMRLAVSRRAEGKEGSPVGDGQTGRTTPPADPAHMKTKGAVSFFHGGVRQLSPYTLRIDDSGAEPRGFLEKGGGDTPLFFEFVYSNRWAWNDARIGAAAARESEETGGEGTGWAGLNLFNADYIDFDTRIGFTFAKDSKLEPGAIAGSGDVGMELNLSRHLARGFLYENDGSYSVNAELAYGLVTDKSSFHARQRYFAGLGYTGSYAGWGRDGGTVLLHLRAGYTGIDALQFKSRTSREIELEYGDLPRYRTEDAWAIESELIYPLTKDAHLTMGARIYGGLSPTPWSVHIGYTKSLGDIVNAFLPGGRGDKPAETPATDSSEKILKSSPQSSPTISSPPRF